MDIKKSMAAATYRSRTVWCDNNNNCETAIINMVHYYADSLYINEYLLRTTIVGVILC